MAKMKIIKDDSYNKVRFDSLPLGEVFVYENRYYLKTANTTAMDLTNVHTMKFDPEIMATYVEKAELYLNYWKEKNYGYKW